MTCQLDAFTMAHCSLFLERPCGSAVGSVCREMTQRFETDSGEEQAKNVPSDSRYFEILNFALALPSLFGVAHEPRLEDHTVTRPGEHGVVGVITILSPKSIMIWLGWGDLQPSDTIGSSGASPESTNSKRTSAIGKCTSPQTFVRQVPYVLVANYKRSAVWALNF